MIVDILIWALAVAGLFPTAIGTLTVFYWLKPAKLPADTSNRVNNIASWWIGLTRPDVLAASYKFFRQDIMDNVIELERNQSLYEKQEK
jgi:hypothetical protein